MADSIILARKFRAALLERDAEAQLQVLRAYEKIWSKLTNEIERIVTQIQSQGGSPSLLFEQQRLQQIQDQLAIEIDKVATYAGKLTSQEQATVVNAARTHAVRLMESAAQRNVGTIVQFASLPKDELQHLIGLAQDGSPVSDLFKELARLFKLDSGEAIKDSLLKGIALGSNPRAITADIRRQVDAADTAQQDPKVVRRLNTAVRQQVLGAYREATRLTYNENKQLLSGWIWTATRSATTCIICWAMDGTVFPSDAPMVSHLNCRCVMRPLLPGQSPGELGPQAFAKLARGVQKEILGDLAFSAYESGMVELQDFVGIRSDHRWGDSRFRVGLEDIIGKATTQKLRLRVSR